MPLSGALCQRADWGFRNASVPSVEPPSMIIHSKSVSVCAFMEAAVWVKPLRLLRVTVMMERVLVVIYARNMSKTL